MDVLDEDLPVKIFKIPIPDSHSNIGDGDGDDGVFPHMMVMVMVMETVMMEKYFPNLCSQMMVINPSQGILEAEEEEEERKEVSHSDFFSIYIKSLFGMV